MKFDLIVLGGGSGGIANAVRAAEHGANVAVVEEEYIGGTCVNLGCIPKKIMFNASIVAEMLKKSSDYGFIPIDIKLQWEILVSRRNAFIKNLREIYTNKFTENNITYLAGKAVFVDKNTIEVNGNHHQAEHITIATGGRPLLPHDLPGVEYAIDSDGFFEMKTSPNKVAIIGGGYIGVELAGILNSLGAETHLIIRSEFPLSRFDSMLRKTLLQMMRQQGIKIYCNQHENHIRLQKDNRKSIYAKSGTILADLDEVILAVGRAPQTMDLNLAAIGVEMDKRGLIAVDRYQNTSVSGIYAIGDVTDSYALTPVAVAAGRKLSDRLFGGKIDAFLNLDTVSTVVFSHPPIGSIGLSEEKAIAKFGKEQIKIYETRFNPIFEALSENKIPVAMKLVTTGIEEKIVGMHVIGHGSDEIVQGFAVAIGMGACKRDLDSTLAIHPTSAEELVTIK